MPLVIEYFSPAVQALNEEILHHPDLQERLSHITPNEFEERLATIASFCDVLMDGFFYKEDLDQIAHLLVMKLRERRTGIITLS